MSISYQIVFAMLVFEKFLSTSTLVTRLQYGLSVLFVLVLLLFLDSLNNVLTRQAAHADHKHDAHTDATLHAKLFFAQRNLYLTGSVLFLSLVLNRFFALIVELFKNEEKTEVLKAQAAKTSKEYMKLLDSEEAKDKEIDELKKKLAEADKKARDFDILKKQATQTAEEYMRLTDKVVELEGRNSVSESRKAK
eukprot:jgi/Hompol1/5559/HPOL_004562-RA